MIKAILNKFSKNTFLTDQFGQCVTYKDVIEIALKKEFESTKRHLVFCIIDNSVGGIAGYSALLAANAVPMIINSSMPSRHLDNLIATYNPEYIFLPELDAERLQNSASKISCYGYVLLRLTNAIDAAPLHDDLALLLSTSGSTGSGKYVRLSNQNIWSNATAIADYLSLTADELPITTLPPSYSFGLSIIHSHLLVGAGLAVSNKTFFDTDFWNFLREVKASSLSGVPYHFEMLKKLRFTKMELPHIRTLTQAGGRMSQDLTREYVVHCQSKGIRFFTMYGQTEASPRISYVPAEQAFAKVGTIGIPIPGGTIELQSETTSEVLTESHAVGELVYRGPNVCLGYSESRQDLSLGNINCGVLYTGDLAMRDDDGYYRIVGRQKRFIKLFGNRINLHDVELQLSGFEVEVACSGRDDVLEVYLSSGSAAHALEIKQAVMSNLQVAARGVMLYEIDALPRNESGKVQYSELHPEKSRLLA
jgi:long-chain acyl-CoA synthetase